MWQNKGNEVFVRVVLSYVGKAKYIYVFITAEAYIDTRKTFDRIEMATAANAEKKLFGISLNRKAYVHGQTVFFYGSSHALYDCAGGSK